MEDTYKRVGTAYYKESEKPLSSGDTTTVLLKWNRQAIIDDRGKKYVDNIPKYDGFCCIPSHLQFQQEIEGYLNTYHEIPIQPIEADKTEKDQIRHSMTFLQHIFGDQLEMGLDYLKILFEKPTQTLPILCLVSKERSTGKSTFIKWLKLIFGFNLTYVKGDTFGSQFNADWADKLLIAIDEVFFDKKEITERLKFLSTTNRDKMEAKGKDRVEIEFFGKFILCSNNEDNFIQIDENETRFWVRKIPPIHKENTDFLEMLQEEIPAFLRCLINSSFSTERKTRMWFTANQIQTKALKNLILKNNKLEVKMIELFFEFFQAQEEAEKIEVVPGDVVNMIKQMFYKYKYWSRNDVRKILKEKWNLSPKENGLTYSRHRINIDGDFIAESVVGRFYTIKKSFIAKKMLNC